MENAIEWNPFQGLSQIGGVRTTRSTYSGGAFFWATTFGTGPSILTFAQSQWNKFEVIAFGVVTLFTDCIVATVIGHHMRYPLFAPAMFLPTAVDLISLESRRTRTHPHRSDHPLHLGAKHVIKQAAVEV
ncbi:hypothetical protein V1291_004021 [Nitrobacteraceae bacterium AZCC 1564]